MNRLSALTVVLLVLMGGCATQQSPTQGQTPDIQTTPTTSTPDTGTSTSSFLSTTGTTTDHPTTTQAPYPNPWGKRLVEVGLDPNGEQSRDVSPFIKEAVDWWNDNRVDLYGAYPVKFTYVGPTRDADIVVYFTKNLETCGNEYNPDRFLGCASILRANGHPSQPEIIQIRAGYTEEDTLMTLQHELGHILGIEHGEDPLFVMNESHVSIPLSRPNATERTNPWKNDTLTVAITAAEVFETRSRQEVSHALEFYEDGAGGWLGFNPEFVLVENESTADIHIRITTEQYQCGSSGRASCMDGPSGFDTDTDDAIEYYSRMEITVSGIDFSRVAWHVGYWLAGGFGAESQEQMPEEFQEGADRERWWR